MNGEVKMTCKLLWKKPISLSRAAKLMSRFAAVDSGATAAVSKSVQRSADAFTHLAHFRSKTSAKPPTAGQSALTNVNAVAGDAAEPEPKKKKRKRRMNDDDDDVDVDVDVESHPIQKRKNV